MKLNVELVAGKRWLFLHFYNSEERIRWNEIKFNQIDHGDKRELFEYDFTQTRYRHHAYVSFFITDGYSRNGPYDSYLFSIKPSVGGTTLGLMEKITVIPKDDYITIDKSGMIEVKVNMERREKLPRVPENVSFVHWRKLSSSVNRLTEDDNRLTEDDNRLTEEDKKEEREKRKNHSSFFLTKEKEEKEEQEKEEGEVMTKKPKLMEGFLDNLRKKYQDEILLFSEIEKLQNENLTIIYEKCLRMQKLGEIKVIIPCQSPEIAQKLLKLVNLGHYAKTENNQLVISLV